MIRRFADWRFPAPAIMAPFASGLAFVGSIDHGTSIVIGETAVVEDGVSMLIVPMSVATTANLMVVDGL